MFPTERLRPLLEPFSQAMDLALQSIPGGEDPASAIANTHVRLTLDRELSGHADDALAGWCARNRHPTRPRAVSTRSNVPSSVKESTTTKPQMAVSAEIGRAAEETIVGACGRAEEMA